MFRITVKDSREQWTEDYPNLGSKQRGVRAWEVTNQEDAERVGRHFVDEYNKFLRPEERPREFVSALYLGEDADNVPF